MSITRFSTGFVGDTALAGNTSFSASDFELISTIRVGSAGASSITFSNIPQEYKHLQIRALTRGTDTGSVGIGNQFIIINGDTASTTYARHEIIGNGSTAYSQGGSSTSTYGNFYAVGCAAGGNTANTFNINIIDILDYTSSKNKTIKYFTGADFNTSNGMLSLGSILWLNTSAITSFGLDPWAPLFSQYSKFSLYGIRG